MSNELIVVFGTQKTLVSSGASLSNNTMSAASAQTYDIATDGGYYPDAEFVLSATFATAPTANTSLDLYARELDIDGTNDAQAPSTTFRFRYVCSFPVNATTSTQYIKAVVPDVPVLAEYYLHNNGTGQTVSSGWTLKVRPRTVAPAA